MSGAFVELKLLSLATLMDLVAGQDREAFEELYRRTSAKLFAVCLQILPRDEAEEVLQDVYLTVWRRALGFDPERGRPMTWLITITRNRAVDRFRAAGRAGLVPIERTDTLIDERPTAGDILEQREEERNLAFCLGRLSVEEDRFLRTAFFEGVTYSDLAARASIPLGTLKSRVRRALLKLRACLSEFEWQLD